MIEIEGNISQVSQVRLDDMLSFCESVYDCLEKKNELSTVDYEAFKKVREEVKSLTTKEGLNESSIIVEKLKAFVENITKITHSKSEVDFISDFFITQNSNQKHEWEPSTQNSKGQVKTDFSDIPTVDLSDKRFICDALVLTSAEFLKDKLNLDEECIRNILGNDYQNLIKQNNLANDNEEDKPFVARKNKIILQPLTVKKDPELNKQVSTMEKEIQEEIDSDILKHTRDLKEYAKKFNQDLQKDLLTLDGIEQIQNVGKTKTDKQLKNLTKFNYNLKIGFWKMLLMIITVIITFIICLFVIRFFPKLVK